MSVAHSCTYCRLSCIHVSFLVNAVKSIVPLIASKIGEQALKWLFLTTDFDPFHFLTQEKPTSN